jgi:enamine deaminase RidA (YjgF/YER057c/UK114 family)
LLKLKQAKKGEIMRVIENRLKELGLELPKASTPIQNYVPFVRTGNLLFISGQVSYHADGEVFIGKLGDSATLEEATMACQRSALSVMAQIKEAIGNLDNVVRIVKLNGFIHATPESFNISVAMNGASDIFVNVFGEKGRHARTTLGTSPLPRSALCEIDAVVEVA